MQVCVQMTGWIISLYSIFPSLPQGIICLSRKETSSLLNEGPSICLKNCFYYIQLVEGWQCVWTRYKTQRINSPCSTETKTTLLSQLVLASEACTMTFSQWGKEQSASNVPGASLHMNEKKGKIKCDEHDCHSISYPSAFCWAFTFAWTKLKWFPPFLL